jgi:hypothetical protein
MDFLPLDLRKIIYLYAETWSLNDLYQQNWRIKLVSTLQSNCFHASCDLEDGLVESKGTWVMFDIHFDYIPLWRECRCNLRGLIMRMTPLCKEMEDKSRYHAWVSEAEYWASCSRSKDTSM